MRDRLLSAIAQAVGTPVYVYDLAAIRERYATLERALSAAGPFRIHYSVKANSNHAVLATMCALGAGADIVSHGELVRALAAGFAPDDVVFSGVGKTDAELDAAMTAGVGLINLESEEEAERLLALAAGRGVGARVGIRLNPDVTTESHPYTQTGALGMKFGVPMDRVRALARRIADGPGTVLACVGMHIGSQIVAGGPYRLGAERLLDVVHHLRAGGIDTLGSVDVGGGLGIAYEPNGPRLDPTEFAAAIAPLRTETGLLLRVEPGRYLVGQAGVLLARIVCRKQSGGRTFVIADAGMNDLLRPSLYEAVHGIRVVDGVAHDERERVDIVGPLCESGDFLGLGRNLAGAVPGALLAVEAAGAYGFTMSSQYNSRLRPAEVIVDGNRWAVARDREGPEDLTRGEHAAPHWVPEEVA